MNTTTTKNVFKRPADKNFDTMNDLVAQAQEDMDNSRRIRVQSTDINFSQDADNEVTIDLDKETHLPLTHFSLGQVSSMAKLPMSVVQRLHEKTRQDLIVDNLNTLFPMTYGDVKSALIHDEKDEFGNTINSTVRAMNGSAYSQLWDASVFEEIDDWLTPLGFSPQIPAGHARGGFMHNSRAALYRGDQSSFGFFFAKDESGYGNAIGGFHPGIMVWNSEVGDRSFGFHTFYYHIATGSIVVWTPANHKRKRFVHRGDISKGFKEYVATLEDTSKNFEARYLSDINIFNDAATTKFAPDDNSAAQKLKESMGIPAMEATHIVETSNKASLNYGDPLSVWRIALAICWEAGQTSRAESLVDKSLIATKFIRKFMKV